MIENFIAVRAGSDPAPQIIRIDPVATSFNAAVRKVIHCDLYEACAFRVGCFCLRA